MSDSDPLTPDEWAKASRRAYAAARIARAALRHQEDPTERTAHTLRSYTRTAHLDGITTEEARTIIDQTRKEAPN